MKCKSFVLIGLACLLLAVFAANSAQAQNFKTLYTFMGTPDGGSQFNDPLLYVNGTLYGTTYGGGVYDGGTVYKISRQGTETVLYSFCSDAGGDCADGWGPQSNVVQDVKGNLYGVALFGGDTTSTNCVNNYGCGTVFKLDKKGNFTVLHTFTGGADGNVPQGLNVDWAGNLYGITFFGGDLSCSTPNNPLGCGTVYKLDKNGNLTVLHTFTGGADGAFPNDYLTLDWAGNIYGVTLQGGNPADCTQYGQIGCGTVFKLGKWGKLTTLYTFTGGTDGWGANGSLVLDAWGGNFYGTTSYGGDLTCNGGNGCGVVFKLTAAGRYKVLHTFSGTPDGANPPMGLTGDLFGNLYGVTLYGGNSTDCTWAVPPGCGTLFNLDQRGKLNVLYTFTGLADGGNPGSAPIMDERGNLYGNTFRGGDLSCAAGRGRGCGVVYKLKPSGGEQDWRETLRDR
jgi:uncharacterized repeat protein (TIGR03803 family)